MCTRPAEPDTLFAPRLVELCFQTAGIWELGTADRMALPTHVDRVSRFAPAGAATRLWAVVTPHDGGADADVVDEAGRVHMRLEGYRTIELPGPTGEDVLKPLREAMT